MKNSFSIKLAILFVLICLLISSVIVPQTIGYEVVISDRDKYLENLTFICSNKYSYSKLENYKRILQRDYSSNEDFESEKKTMTLESSLVVTNGGLMDSDWPMQSHDTFHTGRSPYSTTDNPYDEKWRFEAEGVEDSPVIDDEGTIYFGGGYGGLDWYLIAVNPDGTLKWRYKTGGMIWGSSPAINKNGTIFIGSWDAKLYAINPNGTLKWKIGTGGSIASSPTIAKDGTIYIGTLSSGNSLVAVNPNGTEKWRYKTGYSIASDPAINNDGTIYIGSGDTYFYAINPDGTLKWRYKTGDIVKAPPSIANDGTVYIGSFDGYLYALYPDNGTLKWKYSIGTGTEANPAIGSDGTIYVGGDDLYAINPNGTKKWHFDFGSNKWVSKSSPAICADGIIYVGTHIGSDEGGEIVAINPDGTERWQKKIADDWVDSSPSIAEDGTVYIGSTVNFMADIGYLHAFSVGELEVDANGPYFGLINQPVQFMGSTSGGYRPHSYFWEFGDGKTSEEQNPTHTYKNPDSYTVTFAVTDNESNTAVDTTYAWIQDGNSPPVQPSIDGPSSGKAGTPYDYTFTTTDPDGGIIWYFVDWDDDSNTGWIGPYDSGKGVTISHTWANKGTYTIKCKAKDPYEAESLWGELVVTMPRNRTIANSLFLRFLEQFPLLKQLLISL